MIPNSSIYDVVIVGGGPAGLTAAIYTSRKRLNTLVITKDVGGQAAISGDIENYLGYSAITGPELARHFAEHLATFHDNLHLIEGIKVTALRSATTAGNFEVETEDKQVYQARCIIIASGRNPKMLGIPGEQEFFGRGVVTCTTCDAPLFRDKTVAVIGGGNSAMDATITLTRFAKQIYVVNINKELQGDEILKEQVLSSSKVKVINQANTLRVLGEKFVTGIEIKHTGSGQQEKLEVDGVFVEIGWTPAVEFDSLTKKDQWNRIVVDPYMRTSVPGIFAVGDVNNIDGEQIIIAAGEGSKGALAAADYLMRKK